MDATTTVSVDEFQALEQKVMRAVEIIRSERDARASAEADAASARTEIAELRDKLSLAESARAEVHVLTQERELVRQRVEKMMAQIDELI